MENWIVFFPSVCAQQNPKLALVFHVGRGFYFDKEKSLSDFNYLSS